MAAVPPQIPGLVGWRPLARGGFATVWEAKQLSLNRLVAVKVDRRTLESDAEQRRFLREAGAAGRMSGHPGIVTVHDAGILTDDRPYLVMALCEGGSLTKWVRGEPRPSQEEVREVGVRIADALAATHASGVLHRDVKPANILIDAYGHAGLADFGLAAIPDPGMELNETLEAITPAYAPPEVFHRRPPTDKGDVYSLGATLYAVLAGQPPRWPENGTPNIVDMFERLDEPIDRIPGVGDEFMDALLAAMATDPADRPSAAEFRDRLRALTLGAPTTNGKAVNGHPAAPVSPGDPVGKSEAVAAVGVAKAPANEAPANEAPPVEASPTVLRPPQGPPAEAAAAEAPPAVARPAEAPPAVARPAEAKAADQTEAKATDQPEAKAEPAPTPASSDGGKEPPEQLTVDPEDDRRRSGGRAGILAGAIAVILAIALTAAALANLLPGQESVAPGAPPATTAPATSAPVSSAASPSPEPTPSPEPSDSEEPGTLPPGIEDCTDLAANVYCVTQPECWGSVRSFADAPRLSERADCNEVHLYQTFAIGILDFIPRRQSSLAAVPEVRKACRPAIVNSMLADQNERRDDWEIFALPPQEEDETFFRCIFGRGERTTPIALTR